jgi:hypothetical protein
MKSSAIFCTRNPPNHFKIQNFNEFAYTGREKTGLTGPAAVLTGRSK